MKKKLIRIIILICIIIISSIFIYNRYLNWKFVKDDTHIVEVSKYDEKSNGYVLIETNKEQEEEIKKIYKKTVNPKMHSLSIAEVWQSDWIVKIDDVTLYIVNGEDKMLADTETWHNTVYGALEFANYLNSIK